MKGTILGAVVVLLLAAGAALWGITTRARALAVVTKETRDLAIPAVSVIRPERGAAQEEIVLPGTMQAFTDAPIYARTNGYLKRWHVDIGARVRTGQLLAEIDTPEIDQQLQQARADLATAEANARLAQTTAERYRDLIRTDSVSRQDLDNANGNLEARQAVVESARANLNRLAQLHAFGRIEAPFDGVVTARNTDIGALIDSGGNAKELFHVAAVQKLRVFVNVPEVYSRAVQPGLIAEITLKEFPSRRFAGTLIRTAQAIDVASRTLLTEIDVDNLKRELLPGSYGEVHLKLASGTATVKVPVSALIFKSEGLQVATIHEGGGSERDSGPQRRRSGSGSASGGYEASAVLMPVTIGRDLGSSVEIIAGLTGDEEIIVNPPDSLTSGQAVRIAAPDQRPPSTSR